MAAAAQKCLDTHYIARHIGHSAGVIHIYKNSRLASTSRLRGRPLPDRAGRHYQPACK
jgi:hypothetical protein